jgi:hypothetical protein
MKRAIILALSLVSLPTWAAAQVAADAASMHIASNVRGCLGAAGFLGTFTGRLAGASIGGLVGRSDSAAMSGLGVGMIGGSVVMYWRCRGDQWFVRRVASVPALSSRFKPGDAITVQDLGGDEVTGKFLAASASVLTVTVDGRPWEIPAGSVKRVALPHGGSSVLPGLLVGSAIGAAVGIKASLDSTSKRPTRSNLTGGTLVGLAWGTIVGLMVPRHRVVYESIAPVIRLAPVLSPSRLGVMLLVQFQSM